MTSVVVAGVLARGPELAPADRVGPDWPLVAVFVVAVAAIVLAAMYVLGGRTPTREIRTRDNANLAFGAVRISPDGESLAWYRPESDDDAQPWLVITEDPTALGVEHDWAGDVDVADWTDLQDPDAVRADDALLAEVGDVIAVADPVPADLAERVRRATDAAGGDVS